MKNGWEVARMRRESKGFGPKKIMLSNKRKEVLVFVEGGLADKGPTYEGGQC